MSKAPRPTQSTNGGGSHIAADVNNGNIVRTTLLLPEALDVNLSLWCLRNRVRKNAGIVQILTTFLGSEGMQPTRTTMEIKVGY